MTLTEQIGELMIQFRDEDYHRQTDKQFKHDFNHLIGRVKGRTDYYEKHGKVFISGKDKIDERE
jgi:hypothetical protein